MIIIISGGYEGEVGHLYASEGHHGKVGHSYSSDSALGSPDFGHQKNYGPRSLDTMETNGM